MKFADESEEIVEEPFLLFTSYTCHPFAPCLQVFHLTLVGKSHQCLEHVEEELVLGVDTQHLQCFQPAAVRHASHPLRILLIESPLGDECLSDILVGNAFDIDTLYTAADSLQQPFRFLAYQQEDGLLRRLLQEFQYLVGTFDVHAFRQPDEAHLIAPLARLERQLADQCVALTCRDNRLLVLTPIISNHSFMVK